MTASMLTYAIYVQKWILDLNLSCGIVLKKYTKGFEVQQLPYTKLYYSPPIPNSPAKVLFKPTKYFF